MDDTLLRERLRESEQRNEALSREVASLRATLDHVLQEFAAFRRDHEALVDATRIITAERDALRQRVAELEAANNRLIGHAVGTPQRASQRVSRSAAVGLRRRARSIRPARKSRRSSPPRPRRTKRRDRELLRASGGTAQGPPGASSSAARSFRQPSNVASGFSTFPKSRSRG